MPIYYERAGCSAVIGAIFLLLAIYCKCVVIKIFHLICSFRPLTLSLSHLLLVLLNFDFFIVLSDEGRAFSGS
jgi:hypothetical protein